MELNTLIAECTAYDFKLMLEENKPKSWLKSVSAFADTLGGSLFFGIANDGTIYSMGYNQVFTKDGVKGLTEIQEVIIKEMLIDP